MAAFSTWRVFVFIDLEGFDGTLGHAFEAWASVDILNVEGGVFFARADDVGFGVGTFGFAQWDSLDKGVFVSQLDGDDIIEGIDEIDAVVFVIETHRDDEMFIADRVGVEEEGV